MIRPLAAALMWGAALAVCAAPPVAQAAAPGPAHPASIPQVVVAALPDAPGGGAEGPQGTGDGAPAPTGPRGTPGAVAPSPEDQQLAALLNDLARFGTLPPEEVRREIAAATQVLNRQRTDANRVRLAMIYSMTRAPQDDQRALQLLDTVARSNPGSAAVRQIAVVIQALITERLRAVKDEQVKAEAAIQKLEALRLLERSLLRDRIRSGGGGGGGGGGSGGGSGG